MKNKKAQHIFFDPSEVYFFERSTLDKAKSSAAILGLLFGSLSVDLGSVFVLCFRLSISGILEDFGSPIY